MSSPVELTVIYMDAGQGDCTLITFPNGTIWMVDCGSIKNADVAGDAIVAQLTRVVSSGRIDTLILTHPDQDHYNLLSTVYDPAKGPIKTIGQIIYGGNIDQYKNQLDNNFTYKLLKNGLSALYPRIAKIISPARQANWVPSGISPRGLVIGGVTVNFLYTNLTLGRSSTNNTSITLMLTYQGFKYFLMGDAEEPVEKAIIKAWGTRISGKAGGAVLKLGHHGSNSSTSKDWVEAIEPTYVVVSADTRSFSGRSMPAFSKIENIIDWTTIDPVPQNHNYIVWCDDTSPKYAYYYHKPMSVGLTDTGICTTLCSITYNKSFTNFTSTGSSWQFIMDSSRALSIGWTGDKATIESKHIVSRKKDNMLLCIEDAKSVSSQNVLNDSIDLLSRSVVLNQLQTNNPITVAALTSILSKITSANPFVLNDTELGILAVQQLFDTYLPEKTLTIVSPSASVNTLSVSGQIAFPQISSTNLDVSVTFLCDPTNTYVAGIMIRIALPGWEINTDFLTLSADFLKEFGCSTLYLLLSAIPDPETQIANPQYGVGVDFSFTPSGGVTSVLALNALFTEESTSYVLEGSFDHVTFADINALSCFATGGNFNIIPQDVIPFANALELAGLSILVDTDALGNTCILAAFVDVQVKPSWTVGVFELSTIGATFTVITPSSPSIYAKLYTNFEIASIPFSAAISLDFSTDPTAPGVALQAALMQPMNMTDLLSYLSLSDYNSGSNFNWEIDCLRVYVDLRSQSYIINCGTSGNWSIISSKFALTTLSCMFSAQIGGSAAGNVSATFAIGSANVLVSGSYSDKLWQFTGETIGSTIAVGDFISYIASTFGVSDLPEFITGITVTDFTTTFDTSAVHFAFNITGTIPITSGSVIIDLAVSLDLDPKTNTYQKTLTGTLTIGSATFTINFNTGGSTDTLVIASWSDTKNYLDVSDIFQALGFDVPSLPMDLELESVAFSYDVTKKTFALIASSSSYGTATFVVLKNGATSSFEYFFGLNIDQTIDLTSLPLINDMVGTSNSVSVEEIQVVACNGIAAVDAGTANTAIQTLVSQSGGQKTYPLVPVAGVAQSVGFSMVLDMGGDLFSFNVSSSTNNAIEGISQLSDSSSPEIEWINIQKTVGPITFQKIGVQYQSGKLGFLMNLSLTAGGLTISLLGLGIESPLTNFAPQFTLQGLGVDFQENSVDISGTLLGSLSPVNFTGELILNCSPLSVAALGAYSEVNNSPSFFLYAVLNYPIGGPAFFFVTGLAAGFGFNRKLLIPDLSGVPTFPLVAWAMDQDNPPGMDPSGNIANQVDAVLTTLTSSGVVAPSAGEDWLAIGIQFTSFDLIRSFALLTVVFGTDFEINLLGLSYASLTVGDFTIFYAELALKGSFLPEDGTVIIVGELTPNSYVFSSGCHLTGGFAYCIWLSGPNAGNFVMSMGGYSPAFTPPSFYPQIPHLGFNWQIDSHITVQGDLYYAITSSAIMAGGGFSAVWSCGDIQAWFDVEADFLMVFQPFHYYLDIGIHLGASVRINLLFTTVRITIHVGVDLAIWGPDFTGIADIDLSIISFSISFGGASSTKATTISWSEFATQLLPNNPTTSVQKKTDSSHVADDSSISAIQMQVTGGLNQKISDVAGNLNYIVNGQLFELSVLTLIPIKPNASLGISLAPSALQPTAAPNTDFDVGPTGTRGADFNSSYTITFTALDKQASTVCAVNVLQNVPTALWQLKQFDSNGIPTNFDPLNGTTVSNVLMGYNIIPVVTPLSSTDHVLPVDLQNLLFETDEAHIQHFEWSVPYFVTSDSFTSETIASTITSETATANRNALLSAVKNCSFDVIDQINVTDLATINYLNASPILRFLGEEKAVSV